MRLRPATARCRRRPAARAGAPRRPASPARSNRPDRRTARWPACAPRRRPTPGSAAGRSLGRSVRRRARRCRTPGRSNRVPGAAPVHDEGSHDGRRIPLRGSLSRPQRGPMKISTSAAAPATANVDMLAVAAAKPVALEGAVAELDRALGGTIGRLVKAGEIRGTAGQVTVLHTEGEGVRARRLAVVGLGKRPTADAESVRNAAGAAVRSLAGVRGRTLAFVLDWLPVEADVAARCVVDGAVIGSYRFDRFKTSKTADRPKRPTGLGA